MLAMASFSVFWYGCKGDDEPVVEETDYYYTDHRDGNKYHVLKIGDQYWMTENLRFKPDSGQFWVYDSNDTYLPIYGYLYEWHTACDVCPDGWHLPSYDEWMELVEFLGGDSIAGSKLKSTDTAYWISPNIATNESGFSAMPAGLFSYYSEDPFLWNGFEAKGAMTFFWNSTLIPGNDGSKVETISLGANFKEILPIFISVDPPHYYGLPDAYGASVRCLRNVN